MLHIVKTIRVVLEAELLARTDEAASRAGTNRSALIREALKEHLQRLHIEGLEEQDRLGYEHAPDMEDDQAGWEPATSWDGLTECRTVTGSP